MDIKVPQVIIYSGILVLLAVFYYSIDRDREFDSFFERLFNKSKYLESFRKKNNYVFFIITSRASYLTYGTLIYAVTQIFQLFNASNAYEYGFWGGLFAKFIIFYGLYKIIIFYTKNAADSERLDKIVGRVFHEITPPLLDLKDLYLHSLLGPEKNEYSSRAALKIRDIEMTTNRMIAVINAAQTLYDAKNHLVVDLFKTNDLNQTNTKVFVSVNTLVEIAVLNIKAMSDYSISFKYQYGSNCDILCNKYHIIQILINIIKNGWEASEGHLSEIFIKTKKTERLETDCVRIDIIDNGCGIPIDKRELIFIEKYTTKKFGTGIGLAVVNEFLLEQGGTIEIESPYKHPGFKENLAGTRFTLFINTNIENN